MPPVRAWAVVRHTGTGETTTFALTQDPARADQMAASMPGVITRLFNAQALIAEKSAGTPLDNGMAYCCYCSRPICQALTFMGGDLQAEIEDTGAAS
jgi:hypothetical protein